MLAAYTRSEDLIRIGAYQKGADPDLDRAIAVVPNLKTFTRQAADDIATMQNTLDALMALVE
jgi:flagellum-specific ATP synthase